jgi:hypothetical protein
MVGFTCLLVSTGIDTFSCNHNDCILMGLVQMKPVWILLWASSAVNGFHLNNPQNGSLCSVNCVSNSLLPVVFCSMQQQVCVILSLNPKIMSYNNILTNPSNQYLHTWVRNIRDWQREWSQTLTIRNELLDKSMWGVNGPESQMMK